MLQDQSYCFAQIVPAFLAGGALAVSAGYLRAVRDMPRTVLLHNRFEFIAHIFEVTALVYHSGCTEASIV